MCKRLFSILLSFYILYFTFYISPVLASPYYPADPDAFSRQWYLQKIGAYEAWSQTQGSDNVIVAVIDTGVDLDHPDIKANLWQNSQERFDGQDNDSNRYIDDIQGWDFVDGDNNPSPNIDELDTRIQAVHHGTLVAGFIGAIGNNGIGGTGIAWKVKIMPLRALDSRGVGDVGTVMEAIRYAVDKGADIINLSFVGPGFDRDLFVLLQDVQRRGVLMVAAVGNTETDNGANLDASPLYPVCYSGSGGEDVVLGVAAVDKNDKKSTFSNYGANCVDISAPGVDMYGPIYHQPNRGYTELFSGGWAGSSMAAPLVTGTAALIKALNPAYQAREIRNVLVNSADPIDDLNSNYTGKLGRGRLNIQKALQAAMIGGNAIFSAPLSNGGGIPYIIIAPFSKAAPEVQILLGSGLPASKFLAYGINFRGGMYLSGGDVDGDGVGEIVTGAGYGGGPHVRVFESDGRVIGSFFAYNPGFRGGVRVAAGDINGDGIAEIVTASGPGGGPHVRIFNAHGQVLGSFFAYDKNLRGGVHLAIADLDDDGVSEIITAPGRGAGYKGEIKVFDSRGNIKRKISAYPENFSGGVSVAAGDLDGNGTMEIITAPASGALPEVRVYSANGDWQRAFIAYADRFQGGVNLAVGDLDRDGQTEIITGPGAGGGPHLIVFDGFGRIKNQFFPMDKSFRGGLSVGIIKI